MVTFMEFSSKAQTSALYTQYGIERNSYSSFSNECVGYLIMWILSFFIAYQRVKYLRKLFCSMHFYQM